MDLKKIKTLAEAVLVPSNKWVIRFDDTDLYDDDEVPVTLYNYESGFDVRLSEASRYDSEEEAKEVAKDLMGSLTIMLEPSNDREQILAKAVLYLLLNIEKLKNDST